MTELARPYLRDGRSKMVRRPDASATQRIVCYRTMCCLGYNAAHDARASQEVLDYLFAEHDWALRRMIAAGIDLCGDPTASPKGQMELFG